MRRAVYKFSLDSDLGYQEVNVLGFEKLLRIKVQRYAELEQVVLYVEVDLDGTSYTTIKIYMRDTGSILDSDLCPGRATYLDTLMLDQGSNVRHVWYSMI